MAYSHGSKAALHVNGRDYSGYLTSVSHGGSIDTAETTTLGATAKAYIPGIQDAALTADGIYDGAANQIDAHIAAGFGSTNAVACSYLPQGDTLGNIAYVGKLHQTSYEIATPVDGVASITLEGQADGGLSRGVVLQSLAAKTATGNGTSYDGTASSSAGFVAALHVTAASGTTPSLTARVEHSADNSTWATLGTFTAATSANSSEVITGTGTVNRYLRAAWTISGTGPSFTVGVSAARK